MSSSDPRSPSPEGAQPTVPDPDPAPAPAPDPDPDDRLAGFFDEAVRDPESGPRTPDEGDLLIVRNASEELAVAAEDETTRRAEEEADDLGLLGNSPPQAADSPPPGEPEAAEPAEPEPPGSDPAAEERGSRALFLEPDLSPSRAPGSADAGAAYAAAVAAPASGADGKPAAHRPKRRARPRRRRPGPPGASLFALIGGGALLGFASWQAIARVEPFYTWYYVFAWYPFLMAINHLTAMRSREHSVFAGRARTIAAMLAWSVPAWLVFEAFNFRLQDWYYIGVPRALAPRELGIVVSFATVLPGVLLLEELLRVLGLFARLRTPAFAWHRRADGIVLGTGAAWAALVLLLPQLFYPLVWGIPVLLLEPWLRRGGGPSLARDLSEGRPGRVLRLLVAGMICGPWWEAANTIAGGKWVYTVPGLDALRPFEMPLIGFIGFAPFALCLWTMARALVRLGLLPDWERTGAADAETPDLAAANAAATATATGGTAATEMVEEATTSADETAGAPDLPDVPASGGGRTPSRRNAILAATAFSVLVLAGMNRWTVDSFTAHAADVPGVPDGVPEYARHHHLDSVRGLLQIVERGDLYVPGESNARMVEALGNACRLSLLHGIGTDNARRLIAVGVGSVEELAASDPDRLTAALRTYEERGWSPRPRRVAEWVRAARREAPAAAPLRVIPDEAPISGS